MSELRAGSMRVNPPFPALDESSAAESLFGNSFIVRNRPQIYSSISLKEYWGLGAECVDLIENIFFKIRYWMEGFCKIGCFCERAARLERAASPLKRAMEQAWDRLQS